MEYLPLEALDCISIFLNYCKFFVCVKKKIKKNCFHILLIITLVILASQESLSTHFNFQMNGVSLDIDSLLGHSNKKQQSVHSSLGHPYDIY